MHAPLTDLKRLRAVCAVHALGSTVQAAVALRVAQSSVTRAILELEAGLGQALFHRTARGMQPTPQASALLERASRALSCLAVIGGPEGRTGVHGLSWLLSRYAMGLSQRQMQVLLSLADQLSLPGAAAMLGVGSSAVHQSLGQIEHLAAGALFLRSRRGLRLTELGEVAVRAVKLAQAELAQAEQEMSWRAGELRGQLVIGTLPFSTSLLLPQAVEAVLRAHPGLSIHIVDGTYDALSQRLLQADIDLMLGALRPQPPAAELRQELLFEDGLAVVVRAGHPLAGRKRVAWAELAQAEWIMPMPHTPAQAAFEQALRAAGLALPAAALRVNSALMMHALLAESDRLALMSPRQVRREVQAGLLAVLPVPVEHRPRPIGLLLRADYLPPPGARLMLQTLRELGQALS